MEEPKETPREKLKALIAKATDPRAMSAVAMLIAVFAPGIGAPTVESCLNILRVFGLMI